MLDSIEFPLKIYWKETKFGSGVEIARRKHITSSLRISPPGQQTTLRSDARARRLIRPSDINGRDEHITRRHRT
jgi:hypothetical protein